MVLAAWLEAKLERMREERRAEDIKQGIAEGRAMGRATGHAVGRAMADREWEAWNRRREAALARGEPFAEPPPSRNGARP